MYDSLQGRLDEYAKDAGVRLRMGVMPWKEHTPPGEMVEHAHTACHLARGYYKEHIVVFNKELRDREALEKRLQNDLARGLEEREFEVYYQPKFDIQSEHPVLKSAEALVRWKHHELGMIPPSDFIPLFERSGQINAVDKYVWSETARQIARWRDRYGFILPVSVNLSRVDVFDPMLENTLEQLIEENGLVHSAFKLEVTESAYTDNAEQLLEIIGRLSKKGYEIEMDDFGTGYSSLNMLSLMPINVLKMDRSYIQSIEHNKKDVQLVKLILGIAGNLKVPVVAEGVETEAQLKLLRELGCELVQGYYFSRPLPAAEFEERFMQA